MTPAEIEAQARTLEAAALLLRRETTARDLTEAVALLRKLPVLVLDDDGQPAAKALVAALAKTCRAGKTLRAGLAHAEQVERWLRTEIAEVLDELQDADIQAAPPRTTPAVDALRAACIDAARRMPDPED